MFRFFHLQHCLKLNISWLYCGEVSLQGVNNKSCFQIKSMLMDMGGYKSWFAYKHNLAYIDLFHIPKSQVKMSQWIFRLRGCFGSKVYSEVPDGGWGWIVAVAFFLVEVFTYGVIKSFGIFLKDLMSDFDETNSRVSWIISICVFVMTFTGEKCNFYIKSFCQCFYLKLF